MIAIIFRRYFRDRQTVAIESGSTVSWIAYYSRSYSHLSTHQSTTLWSASSGLSYGNVKQAAPYSTAEGLRFLSDCAVDWLSARDWQTRVLAKCYNLNFSFLINSFPSFSPILLVRASWKLLHDLSILLDYKMGGPSLQSGKQNQS